MAGKENPVALAGAYRGIAKTARLHVFNPQVTTFRALKQDECVPDALVLPVILRRGTITLWVRACPFCSAEHMHGGGSGDRDPHKMLQACQGHRAAHCSQFGWPHNYEDKGGVYRLAWRGEPAQFAPGALTPSERPTWLAKETARRLEARGVPVFYRPIFSAIPSKIWRWR